MRIARFVKAARALLLMQMVAAVIATGLGLWAVLAVRDLATERDRLRAQVTALEQGRPGAEADVGAQATPDGPAPSPLDSEVRPPAIMPVMIPIVSDAPRDTPVPVEPPATADPATGEPVTPPATATDCGGPNQPRCRPGRWSRGDPRTVTPVNPSRPVPPSREEPHRQRTDAPR